MQRAKVLCKHALLDDLTPLHMLASNKNSCRPVVTARVAIRTGEPQLDTTS